jgi:hypothetical protein
MREDNLMPRIRARKSRIRQRLDRHPYERGPFRFARRKALEIAVGLSLLALCGAEAFHFASHLIPESHRVTPAH